MVRMDSTRPDTWDRRPGRQIVQDLWQVKHSSSFITLNAFLPLWHAPQNCPAAILFMVSVSPPFCILKGVGWQLLEMSPRARWIRWANVTGPREPAAPVKATGGVVAAGDFAPARKLWHWAQG